MLFNSQAFLFLFLPGAWLVWFALRRRGAGDGSGAWLLACSTVFYAWWNWRYLALLAPLVVFNFRLALHLSPDAGHSAGRRKTLLVLGIATNVGVLAYFKYANFLLANVGDLVGWTAPVLRIVLPLGISFFVFQKIAYLVDVARGLPPERRLVRYALFVSFFPQLIAGPITHYAEIRPSFDRPPRDPAGMRWDLCVGLSIFAIGLAKKVLVADHLGPFADAAFEAAAQGQPLDAASAWIGALCYTFQLYFDFSGYSDMAVGLARMFGIDLPWNFHSPYKAVNIRDFWRRWHITLSSFLRDYIYIPLGGRRRALPRTMFNLLVTMAIGGLWHGANWTFVLWGLYHGALLAVHRAATAVGIALPALPARSITFVLVLLGWVTFRSADLDAARAYYGAMVSMSAAPSRIDPWGLAWICVAAALAWLGPATVELFRSELRLLPDTMRSVGRVGSLSWTPARTVAASFAGLLLASVLLLNRIAPFLYFQF